MQKMHFYKNPKKSLENVQISCHSKYGVHFCLFVEFVQNQGKLLILLKVIISKSNALSSNIG